MSQFSFLFLRQDKALQALIQVFGDYAYRDSLSRLALVSLPPSIFSLFGHCAIAPLPCALLPVHFANPVAISFSVPALILCS